MNECPQMQAQYIGNAVTQACREKLLSPPNGKFLRTRRDPAEAARKITQFGLLLPRENVWEGAFKPYISCTLQIISFIVSCSI